MYLQWKTHTRRRDAVAGSHHSWGAAYSSAHKRTKRACCTQEIAATQFTIVKQRWRTRSHTHSCTFIRTIILMHARAHRAVHTQARTHWCWLPLRLGLWTVQWGLFSAKWIAPLIPHHALCVGVCAAPPCELVTARLVCMYCVFAWVLHPLCGPSWGVRAVLHVARPHKRAVRAKFEASGKLLNNLVFHWLLISILRQDQLNLNQVWSLWLFSKVTDVMIKW